MVSWIEHGRCVLIHESLSIRVKEASRMLPVLPVNFRRQLRRISRDISNLNEAGRPRGGRPSWSPGVHPTAGAKWLLSQFHFGGALAALVLRGFGDGGHVGVAAEIFAESAAKDAHAGAVHDPDAGQAGEEG